MGSKNIGSYRDLIVWQKAHALAKSVIAVCAKYPRNDEAIIIRKQLLRSSTSIAANIAEGYGGNKGKVFQNSLTIARREATETDYWLLLSFELGFIKQEEHANIESGYHEVRAMLSSLIKKLDSSSDC
ncbi:MAG: four helix bundle protein [Nitrospirae bacterium]|nr:MAG: four helix bundle protein [Nitrospirota bacterium]